MAQNKSLIEISDKTPSLSINNRPKLSESFYRKGKGKAIPLQAWTGPEGSRRLRLPHFKTISTWRW